YVGIGSDKDWWHFAKGWNENKKGFRTSASEYRLTKDIDFGGNCNSRGECTGQNYANYWIDGLGCTSMIVGFDYSNAFNKTFDGQGYTLKNINIETTSLSNKPEYVGIFGVIEKATIKNINVDYMGGGIKLKDGFAGGFAGIAAGTFSNISLKNIGNINADGAAYSIGGFSGFAYGGFANISLDGINSISGGHVGGFAGNASGTFSNISLVNIGSISAKNFAGGFAAGGKIEKSEFKNIYIFFNPNAKMSGGRNRIGKFYGDNFWTPTYTFNNIYIYYKNGDLANANSDDRYKNKFNIHTYSNSNQESVYQDFLSKANTISKPTPPSNPSNPPDLIDTIDTNVKLDENDLHQDIINEIINDIINNHYELNIANLLNMLKDKTNYTNMNEEQKTNFIAKYFLKGDTTKALEVVQSLDFLLAYENNGLSTASNDKFEANGFAIKEAILKQANKTTKNIKDKINQLDSELKPLVDNSNKYLKDLVVIQNKLDEVVNAYNKYVDLINKGLANKNDLEFIILKNKLDTLMKDSQILADLINTNQKELSIWQNKNNTENFKVIGAFANVILNTNPKLNQITGDGGDGEDPNKPDLPKTDMNFEQTASLNLIGDSTLEEESKKQKIEETTLRQRGKICIVNDNFKTMNPCVVKSF
ncbi:hypothetical protein, partial [Campylobacter armoricus]|uniref:hypothetical protein n=2 Tax=Campylobacter armoricus TaxID=2505970 RepID=UPI0013760E62